MKIFNPLTIGNARRISDSYYQRLLKMIDLESFNIVYGELREKLNGLDGRTEGYLPSSVLLLEGRFLKLKVSRESAMFDRDVIKR